MEAPIDENEILGNSMIRDWVRYPNEIDTFQDLFWFRVRKLTGKYLLDMTIDTNAKFFSGQGFLLLLPVQLLEYFSEEKWTRVLSLGLGA